LDYIFFLTVKLDVTSLFVRLISHQPAVLFSRDKPATSNQPAVLFSQNKSAPAISHQPNEQAGTFSAIFVTQLITQGEKFWRMFVTFVKLDVTTFSAILSPN
jgi:hypothetical protein